LLLAACVGLPLSSGAEEHEASSDGTGHASIEANRERDTQEARAVLERMSGFLAGHERFAFDAEIGWDTLQPNGQRLEFGGTRRLTARRPDRFRLDSRNRDGGVGSIVFDGKQLSLDFPGLEAYAQVEKRAPIDETLDYLIDALETPAPLSELARRDLYAHLGDAIEYGVVIGDETLAGKECTHVAFRAADRDIQVWIERGDRPLPVRLVITYSGSEGAPQFWSQFVDWEIGLDTPDALFAYEPPENAERLDFLTGDVTPPAQETP
jgi:hypothetical protein